MILTDETEFDLQLHLLIILRMPACAPLPFLCVCEICGLEKPTPATRI
jgi:hypothetical protein